MAGGAKRDEVIPGIIRWISVPMMGL